MIAARHASNAASWIRAPPERGELGFAKEAQRRKRQRARVLAHQQVNRNRQRDQREPEQRRRRQSTRST